MTGDSRGSAFARAAVSVLVPAAVMSAVLVPVAALRPLDEDEGYYALAAKLVAHGDTPYVDFWYPQAPLMPYAYGGWQRIFQESWYAARGLSVLLAIALACMVYRYVVRRWASRRLALVAVLLVATTPLGFEWYPTVKTYALSTLLLFAVYFWTESSSTRAWFASGLFLGLAIDVRLLLASVVIVFLVYARSTSGPVPAWARSGVDPDDLVVRDRARTISQRHTDFADDPQERRALRQHLGEDPDGCPSPRGTTLPVDRRSRHPPPFGVRVSPEAPAAFGCDRGDDRGHQPPADTELPAIFRHADPVPRDRNHRAHPSPGDRGPRSAAALPRDRRRDRHRSGGLVAAPPHRAQ